MKEQNNIERFKNLSREFLRKKSINELSKDIYLDRLSKVDRDNVLLVLSLWIWQLPHLIDPKERIAVHAVGSSVKPEKERYRPVRDIDLRILNSLPTNSEKRKKRISSIIDSFPKEYIISQGWSYKKYPYTLKTRWIKGKSRDAGTGVFKEAMMPYTSWYNNDPSFEINFNRGKIIHVSISGLDNYDLDKYLRMEGKHNGYFCSLYNSSGIQIDKK